MPNANGLLIPISRALLIILLLKEASFPASFLSSSQKGAPNENDNNNIHEQYPFSVLMLHKKFSIKDT